MNAPSNEAFARQCLQHAGTELGAMLGKDHAPFLPVGNQGWMRGTDFYPASYLLRAMARTSAQFFSSHGVFPRISAPVGFNEWITWRKFFDSLKVPESGNKLLTRSYLSAPGAERVRCAHVLWQSDKPTLPDNDAFPAGRYYLKASHGAGLNGPVSYPLQPEARAEAERAAAQWLSLRYGLSHGEWWYNAFRPEVFLEEHLGDDLFSINFFCFRGKVALLVFHNKQTKETITLMPDFRVVGHTNGATDVERLRAQSKVELLCDVASCLTSAHTFVRVDFLVAQTGEPILGELTFTPGNGLSRRPPGIDEYLGRAWAEAHG